LTFRNITSISVSSRLRIAHIGDRLLRHQRGTILLKKFRAELGVGCGVAFVPAHFR
jgi:hypothetical protein